MFKFLKEKFSSVVKKFSKDVEEESEKIEVKEDLKEEIKQETKQETQAKPELKEIKSKQKQESIQEKIEEKKDTKKEEKKEHKKEVEEKNHVQKHSELKHTEEKLEKVKEIKVEKKKEKVEEETVNEKTEPFVEEEVKEDKIEALEKRQSEALSISDKSEKPEKKKGLFSKLFKSKDKKEKIEEELEEEISEKIDEKEESEETPELVEEIESEAEKAEEEQEEFAEDKKEENKNIADSKEESDEAEKPKRGFFTKITETFTKINLSEEKFEELFWDLEVMLLENNVAVEVIQKIKEDLKKELMSDKISRKNVDEIIKDSLKNSLEEILDIKGFNIEDKINNKKPYIIAVIGVNGSGKTTTIAKLCYLLKKKGFSVVLAAADTFRAAAIQQLEYHAEKLDLNMIKHDYNSDPAAVAFDAIKHAEAKKIDVVVIDTAGRLHSNDNLMNELKKLIKVNKPDLKLFVGESITGNDCVEQAKVYDEIIGIDAIILSKADVDEKGGAALSISYVTKKPVLFIGTGQTYEDLKKFDKKEIMEGLGF